ncbi:uncharacterized protein [Hetaerina americana]|uniref:uncharacterized protein n=1 Tax=Hetaerina americana TaxID=62018 RepID=UPI003A7F15A6
MVCCNKCAVNAEYEENDVPALDEKNAKSPGKDVIDDASISLLALSCAVDSVDHSVQMVELKDTCEDSSLLNCTSNNNYNEQKIQIAEDIKEEVNDNAVTSYATDMMAVDVQENMIFEKEEVDIANGFSLVPESDVNLSNIASAQECGNHWSDNEDSGNSDDWKLHLSSDEEVNLKEECDGDIPQEKGGLGGEMLEVQGHIACVELQELRVASLGIQPRPSSQ